MRKMKKVTAFLTAVLLSINMMSAVYADDLAVGEEISASTDSEMDADELNDESESSSDEEKETDKSEDTVDKDGSEDPASEEAVDTTGTDEKEKSEAAEKDEKDTKDKTACSDAENEEDLVEEDSDVYMSYTINGIDIGYAPGSYFSQTGKACTCHGRGTCGEASDCQCIAMPGTFGQCYSFAFYVEKCLFGYTEYSNSSKFENLGSISASNMSASAVKNLLYGKAVIGAHIRTGGSQHSLVITGVDENGFSIIQANGSNNNEYTGHYNCRVGTYYYTWSSYASSTYGKRGISYVKQPKDASPYVAPTTTHTVDSSYPSTIYAYPIATSGTIPVYDVNGSQESNRYISYSDQCTINEVYTDGWCKVTYPTSSGTHTAYVNKTVFFAGSSVTNSSWSPSSTVTAYKRSDLSETFGSVWTTDSCKVTGESGSYYQVIFPLDKGGYKLGWVNTSSSGSSTDDPREETIIPGPVASGAFDGKKIVAVAPETITFSSSEYISKGDICRITDVNPSTGECTVEYPSGSTNVFTASKTKYKTVAINNFINYNGSAQAETATIPEKLTAYPTSDMTATVGSYTSNWYLDPGDTYTTINKIGDSTEVLYYCTTGAHAGYWKLGWVNLSYYSFDINGFLDNSSSGNLSTYGTCDVYINGVKRADDAQDFYITDCPRGSTYTVDDIRAYNGYTYNGVYSGSLTGTVTGNTEVRLNFTKDAAKTTGISISALPSKTEYIEGQTLNTSGLAVNLNYDDGSVKDITSECTVSKLDSTPGVKTIVVTYGSYSTAYTVTVKEKTPVSISVSSMPSKTVYETGEELDLTGLVVKATYDNGTTAEIDDYDLNIDESILDSSGVKKIQVQYNSNDAVVSTSFSVTVQEPIASPTLTVSSASAAAGESFSVTLSLSENPGIASMKLKVSYDESAMTLTDISYNSAWGGNFQQPQTMNSPVILNWYNGAANYTGNSDFATLTFTAANVSEAVTSKLSVTYDEEDIFNIDERNTGLKLSVGSVTISPAEAKPVITSQPESVSVSSGKSVTFAVKADNAASYQWQYSKNGTTWASSTASGARTGTLTFTAADSDNGMQYRCKIIGKDSSVIYSNAAKLTVILSVKIVTQPTDVTASIGDTVHFSVDAENVATYQWVYTKDGSNWYKSGASGAATDTLNVKLTEANADRYYKCKLIDESGNIKFTNIVTVNVDYAVTILTQPTDITAVTGETVSFTVEAKNVSTYQWFFSKDSGKNWYKSGATGAATDTLTFKTSSANAGRVYKCKLTDSTGKSVFSNIVTVTIDDSVRIITQPIDAAASIGETVTFKVEAKNAASYQWFFSKDAGKNWYKSGATGAATDTLTYKLSETNTGRVYKCKIYDSTGKAIFTNIVTATVDDSMRIRTQPADVTASIGDTINFSVEAVNVASYQWFFSKDGGKTWYKSGAIGSTTNSIKFALTSSNTGRVYKCKLIDSAGKIMFTNIVTVNVK